MSGTTTTPILVPEILEVEGFMSPEELECLAYMASKVDSSRFILEIGTFRGRSALALACGSCHGASSPVYTVDPHDEFTGPLGAQYGPMDRVAFFENMAKFPGFAQLIRPICLTSFAASKAFVPSAESIELLLIDGNHNNAHVDVGVWREFLASKDAAVVFDDREYPAVASTIRELLHEDYSPFTDEGVVGKLHILRFNR